MYLEEIYATRNITCRMYINAFLSDRDLLETSEARKLELAAEVSDKLALVDRASIMNLAGVEILVRRLEGLERSLSRVRNRSELGSRKVDELTICDLVYYKARNAELAAEIRAERKTHAQNARWLSEAAQVGGSRPQ